MMQTGEQETSDQKKESKLKETNKKRKRQCCWECRCAYKEDELTKQCRQCWNGVCEGCGYELFNEEVAVCWVCLDEHDGIPEDEEPDIPEHWKCVYCGHFGDTQCDCSIIYQGFPYHDIL
jgi:hypothetical protein